MDRTRLKEQARAWRRRADRESGEDRARSLALAKSYEDLSLNPSNEDSGSKDDQHTD